MSCQIHLNNIGTAFSTTIEDCDGVIDLSTATTKQLIFTKPSGTKLTKDASFVTDGTDGQIRYVSASGDLNELGNWKLQAYIILGSTEYYSKVANFRVHRNL
jgi:hypothetical protein